MLKDMSTLSLSSIWSRNENSRASTISQLESKYDIHYLPKRKNKQQILDNQMKESKRLEYLCSKNAANISLGSSRLSFDMAMATVPKLILRNAKQIKIVEDLLKPYKDNALLAQYMIDRYITKDISKLHHQNNINSNDNNNDDDNDNDNNDNDNNDDNDERNISNIFVTDHNEEDDLEAEFKYLEMERKKIEKIVKQRIRKEKLAARLAMLQERSTCKDIDNDDNIDQANNDELDKLDEEENDEEEEDQNGENENIVENIIEQDEVASDHYDVTTLMKTEKDFKSKRDYVVYRKQMILSSKEENTYNSLVTKQQEIEERLLKLKEKFGEKNRVRVKKWLGLINYFKYLTRLSKRYQIQSARHKVRMKYSRALAVVLRAYRGYKDRKWKRENNITDQYEGTLFDKYKNDVELRSKARAILNSRMDALSLISSFIRSLDKSLKHAVVKFLQRIRTLQFFIRCHELGTEGRFVGFCHLFDLFFHRLQMMIFCYIEGNDIYINSHKKKLLVKMKSHLAAPSKKNLIKEMKTSIFFERLKHKMEGQDMSMILTLSFKFTDTIRRKYFVDYIFESRRNYVHKLEENAKQKISIQKLTTDEVKMWIKNKRDDPLEEHLNDFLEKAQSGLGQNDTKIKIQPMVSFLKNISANDLLELFFDMFQEQRAIYKAEDTLKRSSGTSSVLNASAKKSFLHSANSFMKSSFNSGNDGLGQGGSFAAIPPKDPTPSSNSPRKSFLSNHH